MATGLIEIVKRAALEVVENRQPCDLRFGTVTSKTPLKVQITNQFTIPEKLLVVPRHLTDYKVKVSFDWETKLAGDPEHKHVIESKKTKELTVHNALKVGDKVALIRMTGGQVYYILDRI